MTAEPNRLHPEGASGTAEQYLRSLYGDHNYEASRDHQQRMAGVQFLLADAELKRTEARTRLLDTARYCLLLATTTLFVALLLFAEWVTS